MAWQYLFYLCLFLALAFEFVNGFHDTANAVATVIYTRTMSATKAVILSGFFNFIGVLVTGTAVAHGIIKLLPPEVLVQVPLEASLSVVLAALISSVLWNLSTWYLGIPASSSHTLIGSILGVGLAHSCLPGKVFGGGVNWAKAQDVGLSLLISPLIGLTVVYVLYAFIRPRITNEKLITPVPEGETPPGSVRATLMLTCIAVSFAHGSNDGQKGVGLIMLILTAFYPEYASATVPFWVMVSVALSLGVGTTVGWKRIVVTLGERIGKTHLTPLQGAVAEVTAAATILASSGLGLPVSTTQVLSSGVAGSMLAAGSGVQSGMVKKILLAWVLTLPVSMGLSMALFFLIRYMFGLS